MEEFSKLSPVTAIMADEHELMKKRLEFEHAERNRSATPGCFAT